MSAFRKTFSCFGAASVTKERLTPPLHGEDSQIQCFFPKEEVMSTAQIWLLYLFADYTMLIINQDKTNFTTRTKLILQTYNLSFIVYHAIMILLKCQNLPQSWKIQTCDIPWFQKKLFFVSYKICTFLLWLKPQKIFFFQRIYVLPRPIFS